MARRVITRTLLAVACAFALASPASAQHIEACDAQWLDTIRLRAVLRVELAQLDPAAIDGFTFIVTACTETQAELRLDRAGVAVERDVIELGDVPPNLRARLIGLVLVELVRVSAVGGTVGASGTQPVAPATAAADAPETDAAPAEEAAAPAAEGAAPVDERTETETALASPRSRSVRADDEERPPILMRDTAALEDDIASDRFVDRLARRHVSLTLDSGVRLYMPHDITRLLSTRAQAGYRASIFEMRWTTGPVIANDSVTFDAVELGAGARFRWRGTFLDHRLGVVGTIGLIRTSAFDDTGTIRELHTMTSGSVGFTGSYAFAIRLPRMRLLITSEMGYVRGAQVRTTEFGFTSVKAMVNGFIYGASLGVEIGDRGGG